MRTKARGAILSLEIVFTIAFIAILTSCAIYGYTSHIDSSKNATARAEISSIASAVSQYHYEVGSYPKKLDKLTDTEGSSDELGPWLPELKKDPWGHSYQYVYNDERFIVYSLGKKGSASVNVKSDTSDTLRSKNVVGLIGH